MGLLKQVLLEKQAGIKADVAGNVLSNAVLGAGPGLLGSAVGYSMDAPSKKKMSEREETMLLSALPGVGAYRQAQSAKRSLGEKNSFPNHVSELASPLTTLLASGAAGATLGGALGATSGKLGEGLAVGGLGGIALGSVANVIGTLTGMLSDKISLKEQKKEDEEGNKLLSNLLVPGLGSHRSIMRTRSGYED